MGRFAYLDVNDAKIQEIWLNYLRSRGLRDDSDPIPRGESPEEFRRKWEKYLYSQRPDGAAASASTEGGTVTTVPPKVDAGELPSDVQEDEALKAGGVLLYEHKDFGGRVWVLPPGNYSWIENAGIPNDLISSVKVPKGYKLRIFEHKDFGGRARDITGSVSYLGDDWNDQASSAKVTRS